MLHFAAYVLVHMCDSPVYCGTNFRCIAANIIRPMHGDDDDAAERFTTGSAARTLLDAGDVSNLITSSIVVVPKHACIPHTNEPATSARM